MAAPKPFPSQLRIGTDISKVDRHYKILARLSSGEQHPEHSRRRFLAKVFNRLEWPEVEERLARAEADHGLSRHPSNASSIKFARWLAGRWAAKEAAIKACSPRQIHMRQVSILRPELLAKLCPAFQPLSRPGGKPVMLIDPPAPRVLMSPDVARSRGIAARGIYPAGRRGSGGSDEPKHGGGGGGAAAAIVVEQPLFTHDDSGGQETLQRDRRVRRARTRMADRQMVEFSISHDGDYAVATVLADPGSASAPDMQDIVDDGSADERLHEAEWGDEGFELDGIVE